MANEILGCQKNGDLAPNGKHDDDDDSIDGMGCEPSKHGAFIFKTGIMI